MLPTAWIAVRSQLHCHIELSPAVPYHASTGLTTVLGQHSMVQFQYGLVYLHCHSQPCRAMPSHAGMIARGSVNAVLVTLDGKKIKGLDV